MNDESINKVKQSNLTANDVAGRDLTKNTHHHYYQPVIYKEDANLQRLIKDHEEEKLNDPEYKEFSERLNSFLYKKVEGTLRNLQQKLIDGERESLVDYALDVKDRVTKKIIKTSHYKSAQEIYTYLLSNIRSCYLHEINSKLKSGRFENYEIDELVTNQIIEPFLHNVQGCSLLIDKDELHGLLYILTGNCYIDWDKS